MMVKQYINKINGKKVRLIGESPDGKFIMIHEEQIGNFVIPAELFIKEYKEEKAVGLY